MRKEYEEYPEGIRQGIAQQIVEDDFIESIVKSNRLVVRTANEMGVSPEWLIGRRDSFAREKFNF